MLVEHHIKYKEIHGVDETIWMEHKEHDELHRRLRREKKCNIPPEELRKISTAAYARTRKAKETLARNNKKPSTINCIRRYQKKNQRKFTFNETLMPNILLREFWTYNKATGNICINSYFKGQHGENLYYIDERPATENQHIARRVA